MEDLPSQIECIICKYPALLDAKDQAYKCQVCGTEVWTDARRLKEYRRRVNKMGETREQYLSHINRPMIKEILPIHPEPSGGGGSKSCGRKKPKKKPRVEKWEG